MNTSVSRPKLATLDELLSHEFYKRLVASAESMLPEMRKVRSPKQVVESNFSREIVEVYRTLFSGSFNKLDMASLEHSDYLSHLLPCLTLDSFPLIANLDQKSQEVFKKVKLCSVMTCVWCFVENHSSGRSEYVDVLSNMSSSHKESFECLFFNAAQLLMLESWNENLCDRRDFDSVDRLSVLEQRALLRFFIVCFQRIELAEVRKCCMSLLSPQVWMHIPEELREANFFKNNKVSKMLFLKSYENYKLKHKACNFKVLLGDTTNHASSNSNTNNNDKEVEYVKRLYELKPNSDNLEYLNLSYRLVLSRDFMNSLMNQFVYILEDYLSFFNNTPGSNSSSTDKTSTTTQNNTSNNTDDLDSDEDLDDDLMRLMYVENYLELFVDLLSQLHLRRIVKPMIEYKLLLVRCKNHLLYESFGDSNSSGTDKTSTTTQNNRNKVKYDTNIFVELINILDYYLNFNINEELGVNMDFNVILEEYYKRFNKFQRVCYLNYKDDENLKNIHLINNYSLNTNLENILSNLNLNVLIQLNQKLYLIPTGNATSNTSSNSSSTDKTSTTTQNNNMNGLDKKEENEDYLWPRSVELLPKRKKSKKLVKKLLISNLTNYLKKPVNELVFINKNNFYLNPFSSLFNSSSTLNPELLDRKEGSVSNTDAVGNSSSANLSENTASVSELDSRREDGLVEFEEEMGYIKLGTLSLFKLNLQYLTLFDYLYRNFILYQFEVIFQIKQYIQQQIYILFSFSSQSFRGVYGGNTPNNTGGVSNTGLSTGAKEVGNSSSATGTANKTSRNTDLATTSTSNFSTSDFRQEPKQTAEKTETKWVGRMFISIDSTSMRVGNKRVEMTVTVDLSLVQDYKIRQEWQQLTKYDILYLIQLLPHYSKFSTGNKDNDELLWGKDVRRIRFGEILEVLDEEDNNVLEFNPLDKKSFAGFKMRVKLLVDYEQYMKDIQEDLEYYNSFNLVMRRSKRQNNFKSILTNIQSVLNNKVVIPNWLQVLLLGYRLSDKTSSRNKSKNGTTTDSTNIGNSNVSSVGVAEGNDLGVKRRKKERGVDKDNEVGINYLNTFKSKKHLLKTTRFVSVKLVPCLFNDEDFNGESPLDGERNITLSSPNYSRVCIDRGNRLFEKENRMYFDNIGRDLNEYVYSKKGEVNREELVNRLKETLLNNENVVTFVQKYLNNSYFEDTGNTVSVNSKYNNDNDKEVGNSSSANLSASTANKRRDSKSTNVNKTNSKDKTDTKLPGFLEYLELFGVRFEVYVEESYLRELNKVNDNYYVGDNRTPRFLITNFNEPFQVKRDSDEGTSTTSKEVGNSSSANLSASTASVYDPVMSSNDSVSEFRFVSRQVESIVSGSLEGLAVIMGPPGTGKTDVVSQIIAILFNNFPNEKIVICTHSNFALNDIFTKLVRNEMIDEHYMVRLGHSDLEVDQMGHFSKFGRVNYILQRRLDLLEVIKKLKEQLNVLGDYEFTIQYSLAFLQYYLLNNKELFSTNKGSDGNTDAVGNSSSASGTASENVELMDRGLDSFFRLGLQFPYTLKDVKKLYNKTYQMLESADVSHKNSPKEVGNSSSANLSASTASLSNQSDLRNMKREFVEKLYECLNELLPFEVLRNNRDRMKYLVENYCRIVAMTCTHASIARDELSTLNYKSLVFEEAAQVLEIESFIPICSNIKRLVLCGDHLQLSPIIQNSSLQKYSNLNQSLFLRLVRLKYPYIQLNVQARSKPEILEVYKDFYPHEIYTLDVDYSDEFFNTYDSKTTIGDKEVGNSSSANGTASTASEHKSDERREERGFLSNQETKRATFRSVLLNREQLRERLATQEYKVNLKYSVQFLDVKGEESSPIKYFYQNLDEAHYCVHLYMVMRLLGLEDIVILTAYNGQKYLIDDIVKKKCSWNNRIGSPMVSTIDKFQGRQANYVIVSLVRTKNVGYLRDPRRFVVATSRSKLGLYIVGSKKLIQNIKELSVFNNRLNKYPDKLYLELTPKTKDSEVSEMKGKDDKKGSKEEKNKQTEKKDRDLNDLIEVRDEKELEDLAQILM